MPRRTRHGNTRSTDERCRIAYTERNRILRVIGYDSYAAYTKSSLWSSIRMRVLSERAVCEGCRNKPANQVHHTVYTKTVLEGRTLTGLLALCAGCHYRAEFRDKDHKKLSPKQATAKLRQISTMRSKIIDDFVAVFENDTEF